MKIEPTGVAEGFNVECERKRDVQDYFKALEGG